MVCGGKGINVKMKSDEETEINGMGPRNVLVSMAKDGALLLTEDGDVYEEGVCRGNVINSVGAGEKAETEECSGEAGTHPKRQKPEAALEQQTVRQPEVRLPCSGSYGLSDRHRPHLYGCGIKIVKQNV